MSSTRRLALALLLSGPVAGCGAESHEPDAHGAEDGGADAHVPDAHVDPPTDAWSAADAGREAGACLPHECGDGRCDGGESCVDCARDCGACTCGDGTCEGAETCASCAADCGSCPCGDGTCAVAMGESCANCAADCRCDCADGFCGPREWELCGGGGIGDCGFVDFCGNRLCEEAHAETCLNCPDDCCC
ncbi:MAG: hypothetical protein U0234_19220 [Sandaracinus sp.]